MNEVCGIQDVGALGLLGDEVLWRLLPQVTRGGRGGDALTSDSLIRLVASKVIRYRLLVVQK